MRTVYIIIFMALAFSPLTTLGQKGFEVYGQVKVDDGSLDGAKVVITKDGNAYKNVVLQRSGNFDLTLDFDAVYILSFEQGGYVTKKLQFSTHVPADRKEDGFQPFDFQVNLFKQYEGVNTVIYNQPVGKIGYNKSIDEFDYDTDYTKSIQAQLNLVSKEVEKKQKEGAKVVKNEAAKPRTYPIEQKNQQSTPVKQTAAARQQVTKPSKEVIEVRMSVYTAAQYGSSNQASYGYINYGNGGGIQNLSKEQFDEKRRDYYERQ